MATGARARRGGVVRCSRVDTESQQPPLDCKVADTRPAAAATHNCGVTGRCATLVRSGRLDGDDAGFPFGSRAALALPLVAATCGFVLAARFVAGTELELIAGVLGVALLAVVAGLWPALLAAGLSALAELGMFVSPELGIDYMHEVLRLPIVLFAAALATSGGRLAMDRIGVARGPRRGPR